MALVDSKAAFAGRVEPLGLKDILPAFVDNSVETYAELAFLTSYAPGTDDEVFQKDVVQPILGASATRYALASADVAHRLDGSTSQEPRPLPAEERSSRLELLATKLPGVMIEGQLEPSHRCLNLAHEMWDVNTVKYLDLSSCTTRQAELRGSKTVKSLQPDERGFLKEHAETVIEPARLSDFLTFRQALTRRGLALEVADLLPFAIHELWANMLVGRLQEDVPAGFSRVTMDQAIKADRALWDKLSSTCRAGVRRGSDGKLPLEKVFTTTMVDPMVQLTFAPVFRSATGQLGGQPTGTGSSGSGSRPRGVDADTSVTRELKKLRRELNETRAECKRLRSFSGNREKSRSPVRARGKPAAKRGAGSFRPGVPKELQTKVTRTESGEPLCFGYNIDGCDKAAPGARCPKGWHICAEPKCGGVHSLREQR